MWSWELFGCIVPTVSTMLLFMFAVNLVRYFLGEPLLHIRDVTKHNWACISNTSKAHFCSICETLLMNMNGLYCDSCGVCADHNCVKHADKKLKCKEITYSSDKPMKHHWVKGNLPINAMCDVCDEECSTEPGLFDWWCCWCQRCVHDICKPSKSEEICDFGPFKLMMIPPRSLQVVRKRGSMRRRMQLRSIVPPFWPNWNPIIVVANKKSGSNDGAEVLSSFRRILNPAQVIDLSEQDPIAALEWFKLLGDTPYNVLVAGGDGTIAWLLNSIHKLHLHPVPAVGILPLGTGNDLSRVMGWGKEYDPGTDPAQILRRIMTTKKVYLDRWSVAIKTKSGLGFRGHKQHSFMYNYVSVGVDAQVTLNFHRTRDSRFYLFSHRIFNKLLYLCFGTQQVVEREYKDLDQRLELYLDGELVNLNSIESIVVLNIPSWGAGVDLWNMGHEGDCSLGVQSINDEKLEVVAIYSSFHMAQLQVGLSKPYRIGQAKNVKIKLLTPVAMQIDGEPWHQQPGEINISYVNKASMLMSTDR